MDRHEMTERGLAYTGQTSGPSIRKTYPSPNQSQSQHWDYVAAVWLAAKDHQNEPALIYLPKIKISSARKSKLRTVGSPTQLGGAPERGHRRVVHPSGSRTWANYELRIRYLVNKEGFVPNLKVVNFSYRGTATNSSTHDHEDTARTTTMPPPL